MLRHERPRHGASDRGRRTLVCAVPGTWAHPPRGEIDNHADHAVDAPRLLRDKRSHSTSLLLRVSCQHATRNTAFTTWRPGISSSCPFGGIAKNGNASGSLRLCASAGDCILVRRHDCGTDNDENGSMWAPKILSEFFPPQRCSGAENRQILSLPLCLCGSARDCFSSQPEKVKSRFGSEESCLAFQMIEVGCTIPPQQQRSTQSCRGASPLSFWRFL